MQGHEEFDDEITLAGSGRVTPTADLASQLPIAHIEEADRDGTRAAGEQDAAEAQQASSSQANQ